MKPRKCLSAVLVVIINIFVLTDCAVKEKVKEEGELVFAHVVSFKVLNFHANISIKSFLFDLDFPSRGSHAS